MQTPPLREEGGGATSKKARQMNEHKEPEKQYDFLTNFLTGLGVPANWAKVIGGAIIGALCAIGFLSASSCTFNYSKGANGAVSAHGALSLPKHVEQTVTK